ncbi:MAG: bifunctional riboflavin kinase/FAD synthetase [Dehalococcoidales bacterium]|jgi:riboflavin kinase/FMN adenylyltransferase|nr:bifunctional riboflavin kinase/FAD synthetase [Dehalococcoidales bacterium]MDP6825310.1 bifunctional riboflavin kinase/FAD synthetase [Dehalococcoidales bacterium]|tara:strand:- start:551 stop:1489 length:939 start_codon:yes stop_codon:yes gene_type:complete
MSVETELAKVLPEKDTLLTVGVFDGVHLGHQYLISQLVAQAGQQGLLPGVVTFRQHPQEVLDPRTRLSFLTDLAERSRLLKNEGVAIIVSLSFTAEAARLNARQFVGLLWKYLRMRGVVIGSDFALGQYREGNPDALRALGEEMGFSVTVVPPVKLDRKVVSSTAIRQALADGDVKKVYRLTGHPFSLYGRVVTGAGRGVSLGFPTANLDVDPEQAVPADGVYAGWTYINGRAYQSMINVGRNPTFADSERTVEAYILDYKDDLYGQELRLDIVARLREEKRFDSAEELKRQIAEDIVHGRSILGSGGKGRV